MIPANIVATSYSVMPDGMELGDEHYSHFVVRVEWAGGGKGWAIRRFGECMGAGGVWNYESIPSSRTEEWLDRHRFDLSTALALAESVVNDITINGHTYADCIRLGLRG